MLNSEPAHIVIAGASVAGVAAADGVRAAGFNGRVTLIGSEACLPYDRPPLSKQVLDGRKTLDQIELRPPGHYDERSIDLRLGVAVVALDADSRRIVLGDGSALSFDGCIIATGVRARTPWTGEPAPGVHVLRTRDDAQRLSTALEGQPRVVIIGAGFIGLEVAATARARGCTVVVLEMADAPLARALPRVLGERIAQLHEKEGVDIRCGTAVSSVLAGGGTEGILLADGSVVPADVIVVGAGCLPEDEWLRSSGLELSGGVVCDRYCATAVPGVYAAGDVARWYHELFGEHMRVEHWTNAVEQGRAAASNLVHELSGHPELRRSFSSVPYFWSDQYGAKLQFAGRADRDDDVVVVQDNAEQLVVLLVRADRVTGVFGINAPREVALSRRMIAQNGGLENIVATLRK
jgi:NADPH-dependent 2,4-dienoyl-CoA reductase/sulfur reductase-like enzyme